MISNPYSFRVPIFQPLAVPLPFSARGGQMDLKPMNNDNKTTPAALAASGVANSYDPTSNQVMTQLGTTRFLTRVSEYAWLRQIKDDGRLRFTPLSTYRAGELRDDAERYDEFEGATQIDQPSSVKLLTIRSRDKKTGVPLGQLKTRPVGPIKWFGPNSFSHVLCFTRCERGILSGENTIDLTTEGERFGSSVLLVHDIQAFAERVAEFMRLQNVDFECGPVDYVNNNYEGEYGAFMKPKRLTHQREYRLAVRLDHVGVQEFSIPRLGETMELFEGLKIKFSASSEGE
jgi:hypothetical protein